MSVLTGSLVAGLAAGDPSRAVALTSALAIGAGVGLLVAGLARIGWAVEFISRPIVTGFVFGLVLLIVLGEIPSLLGMPPVRGDVLSRAWSILTHVGSIDATTAVVGLVSLAVLFAGARVLPRVPWALLVLIVGVAVSSWLDLAAHGVAVVGTVPQGVPPFGLPDIARDDIPPVVVGGLALALVGLAEGLSAARLFAVQARLLRGCRPGAARDRGGQRRPRVCPAGWESPAPCPRPPQRSGPAHARSSPV